MDEVFHFLRVGPLMIPFDKVQSKRQDFTARPQDKVMNAQELIDHFGEDIFTLT